MKIIKPLMLALTIAVSVNLHAQRIKLVEGNFSPLKGEQKINTEFVYDNMSVGKFDKEADYVADRTQDLNKKEPGRGDTWAKSWVNDRKSRFEPEFNKLFEESSNLSVASDARYTLIFKTLSTEPGHNIGVSRKNAEINGEVIIVETANRDKVIARATVEKALGRIFGGFDFDTGERLKQAYGDAGKALGRFIKN